MKLVKFMLIGMVISLSILSSRLIAQDTGNKQLTAQEISEKANIAAYYQGKDGKVRAKMVIRSKTGGKYVREFIVLRKNYSDNGDQKYYVYFVKPADVRRMAYLVHKHAAPGVDDDRWMYVPSLDLVHRIAATDKRNSFVGSNFLFEDVSGRALDADDVELLKTTDKGYLIKKTPNDPTEVVEFSYYTMFIDKKTFMPLDIKFYDKKGELYSRIQVAKMLMIQGYPTVVESVVENFKLGLKTVMTFTDVQYNIGLKDNIFEERSLIRAPKECCQCR